MKKIAKIIALFLCIVCSLDGAEALSFLQLQSKNPQDYHDKEVVIRGFIFQTSEGRMILAGEPNVKSCCLGAPEKIRQQIVLDGDISEFKSNSIVMIEGRFVVTPEGLRIEDAKLVK